jgi:hypothetical protein
VLTPVSSRLRYALGVMLLALASPAYAANPPAALEPTPLTVFVCDGAAGFRGPSTALLKLACCGCVPMQVQVVKWSFGDGRMLSDLHGRARHRARGKELACRLLALRAGCPQARICLVSHSTGASVVLTASACVPPGTVDRIVLLAPALSSTYDLSPGLRASREGIDAFSSMGDGLLMGLFLAGTADGYFFTPLAGWCGFKAPCDDGETHALYAAKLRQHTDCYRGHYACVQPDFVREQVVPLLLAHGPEGAAPAAPLTPVPAPTSTLPARLPAVPEQLAH